MLWSVIKHGPEHPARPRPWRRLPVLALDGPRRGADLRRRRRGPPLPQHEVHASESIFDFAGAEAKPGAVRIEINAHQWAWDARYAGPDGKFNTADDIVILNDIGVPVGAPVIFQLASTDVIHSFYVPNLRMKLDAVPGTVNRMWFQAKETGEFEIVCAQHCGTNHYKMRGTLTVLPRAEYRPLGAR